MSPAGHSYAASGLKLEVLWGAWQEAGDRLGYAFFSHKDYPRTILPMTNRVSYAPQDFQKMCKQAERDHESKKLVVLMERVKRQIAERENPDMMAERLKGPSTNDSGMLRLPSRSAPFER
jgi:hypothetical protein